MAVEMACCRWLALLASHGHAVHHWLNLFV